MSAPNIQALPGKRLPPAVGFALGWLFGTAALTFLGSPLSALLGPAYFLLGGSMCLGAGLGLGVYYLATIWHPIGGHGRLPSLAGLAITALSAGALWFGGLQTVWQAGDRFFFRTRFARLYPVYEDVIAELGPAPSESAGGVRHGVQLYVDSGPPARVVFPQPGGMLDNWEGVVYDPSNAVAAARGWDFSSGSQRFTAPPAIVELFGGSIVACQPIRRSWYRCWFT